jgi:hypothetical protein
LLGFLFGLPRPVDDVRQLRAAPDDDSKASAAANGQASLNDAEVSRRPRTNNNLLEISDWLTKVIVGAGLVGLKDLIHWFGGIAQVIGEGSGLQGVALSRVYGGSVMTFFFGWGFLFVYIQTRTIISLIFVTTERTLADVVQRKIDAALPGQVREAVSAEVRENVAPALAKASVGAILQLLYGAPKDAEEQARAFLGQEGNESNARAWLYLACALGQQHAAESNPETKQRLRDEALKALTKALNLDPELTPLARGFMYTDEPSHLEGDDDLESFRNDLAFQELVGPRPESEVD